MIPRRQVLLAMMTMIGTNKPLRFCVCMFALVRLFVCLCICSVHVCRKYSVGHKICHHCACVADATKLKVHTPFQDNSRKLAALTFSHSRSENQRNVEKRKGRQEFATLVWSAFAYFPGPPKNSLIGCQTSTHISPSLLHSLDLLPSKVFVSFYT